MIDSPIDSDENTNDYSIGIRPSKNFDNVTINVTFTASYFADSGTGSTISITKQITLLNDGSLKDEEEDAIDLTIIILLIVALLLILIIIFFFMKMR